MNVGQHPAQIQRKCANFSPQHAVLIDAIVYSEEFDSTHFVVLYTITFYTMLLQLGNEYEAIKVGSILYAYPNFGVKIDVLPRLRHHCIAIMFYRRLA